MKCGNPPTVFHSNELWVLTVQNHSRLKKKNHKLSCENWGISTWQRTFHALGGEKNGKKEITLDPSKSLENVWVREIQSSKKWNGNPGEPITENERQFFLVRGLCCDGWEQGAAYQKSTEETAEGQGAHLTPNIKAWREKKKCWVACSLIQHYTLLSDIKTAAQPLGCWTFLLLIQP